MTLCTRYHVVGSFSVVSLTKKTNVERKEIVLITMCTVNCHNEWTIVLGGGFMKRLNIFFALSRELCR